MANTLHPCFAGFNKRKIGRVGFTNGTWSTLLNLNSVIINKEDLGHLTE